MSEVKANKVTRLDVSNAIKSLGVVAGDILYIRADLGRIGRLEGNVLDVFIGGIFDVLGPEGTLIIPAFTRLSKIWHKNIITFNKNSPPITGALSKRFLRLNNVLRSKHPSHSFCAIGKDAEYLLATHDENEPCFEPMRRLVELKGKMMLVGCVEESPGFSTAHLAQYDLGLSQKHYIKYIYKCKIGEEGRKKIYRPKEAPGCAKGFANFYEDYEGMESFNSGDVGNAFSIVIEADKAYEIEMKLLSQNPRYTLCESSTCISCHLTRGYNKRNIPKAVVNIIAKYLLKLIMK